MVFYLKEREIGGKEIFDALGRKVLKTNLRSDTAMMIGELSPSLSPAVSPLVSHHVTFTHLLFLSLHLRRLSDRLSLRL